MTLGGQRVALAPRPPTRLIFSHTSLPSLGAELQPSLEMGSPGSGGGTPAPGHTVWGAKSGEPALLGGLSQAWSGLSQDPTGAPSQASAEPAGSREGTSQVTVGGTHVALGLGLGTAASPPCASVSGPYICALSPSSQTASPVPPSLCRCPSAPCAPCWPCATCPGLC